MQHRQKKRKFVKKIFALVDPPPTILRPANVSVLPGYDVTLTCLARSTVEHNMTWYRARDYDSLRNDSRVAFLRNGSLSIRYVCAAGESSRTLNESFLVQLIIVTLSITSSITLFVMLYV